MFDGQVEAVARAAPQRGVDLVAVGVQIAPLLIMAMREAIPAIWLTAFAAASRRSGRSRRLHRARRVVRVRGHAEVEVCAAEGRLRKRVLRNRRPPRAAASPRRRARVEAEGADLVVAPREVPVRRIVERNLVRRIVKAAQSASAVRGRSGHTRRGQRARQREAQTANKKLVALNELHRIELPLLLKRLRFRLNSFRFVYTLILGLATYTPRRSAG